MPNDSNERQARAAQLRDRLLEITRARGYIYREQPFKLSSGGYSHDYVDMRRAVARGEDLQVVAESVLADLAADGIDFDAIGGLTMGADPVAHAVALVGSRSWYSVRKAEKDHGRGNRIEGALLGKDTRAIVFEDTTSTGRSVIEALEAVQATGATVVCALTLLDRGELAKQAFAERGVDYRALLSYRDLGIIAVEESPTTAGAQASS